MKGLAWRGSYCWFDPDYEYVRVYRLPHLDSEEASEMYVDDVLDGQGKAGYLDKVVSVSADGQGHGPVVIKEVKQGVFERFKDALPF